MRWMIIPALLLGLVLPLSALGQEEASSLNKYRGYEMSSGYYEEYEVLPGRASPLDLGGLPGRDLDYAPDGQARIPRPRAADAHAGIPNYLQRRCDDPACHPGSDRNLHTIREHMSCRQCHGGEPMAMIDHYYSLMNPIRRHAYVCSKCHQGANASFATYVIHEPNPSHAATLTAFPPLAWAFWIMVGIAVLTFALFLPHTVLWGLREMLSSRANGGDDHG